jgi:hypothetical protein
LTFNGLHDDISWKTELFNMVIKFSYMGEKKSVALVHEWPPLVGEVVPTSADRGCCMVGATDPPGR